MPYPKLTKEPGAIELAAQIHDGAVSPLEAVDAAIKRIEDMDTAINAVVVRDFDKARDSARALTGIPPRMDLSLFGVPITVKESFDIAGLPSCWGHEAYKDQLAVRDSHVVARLKAAGAIILGKTNVPVDLADWQSFNPAYGRTVNPHDHARTPGGSSGGSAAAVASGMVPCDFGTDIGGSVRVPAHFCGIWGHKSSWSLISKDGHDHPIMAGNGAHDGALSIAGPLARNAADLALLLGLTMTHPLRPNGKPLEACRLLILTDHPASPVDESVLRPMKTAIAALEERGVAIDRTSSLLPDLADQQASYLHMLNIAMARGMPGPDGQQASASDWFDLLDLQARNEMAWARLFETYDFVLAPPAPVLAFPHRDEPVFEGDLTVNGKSVPATSALAWAGIATFPNLPATVLPIGASDGLPCGMQVIGPRWSDLDCISTAREIAETLI